MEKYWRPSLFRHYNAKVACRGEGVMVTLSMVSEMEPYLFRMDLVPVWSSVLSALFEEVVF